MSSVTLIRPGPLAAVVGHHEVALRTVLITLIDPDLTADLVVDAETPVGELMPNLGRDQVTGIRVPAGEDVTFATGQAAPRPGLPGGGNQYRFYDFDEKWIVAQRQIP